MSDQASTDPQAPHEANAATSQFQSGREHVKKAAEEFRTAAELKAAELRTVAESKAKELREVATARADEFSKRARTLGEDAETYVRDNPLRAVGAAVGIGFVLGLMFRR